MTTSRFADRVGNALLHGIGVILFLLLGLGFAVTAVWHALIGPFVERSRVRSWQRSPSGEVDLPGTPGWSHRERRVVELVDAFDLAPIEGFDTFEASAAIDASLVLANVRNAPRDVRAAVETAYWRTSAAVVHRGQRDRPEAGGEDYALHNAWFLYEPHWAAAERAAAAGAVAILLEGHMDEIVRSTWTADAERLVG